MTLLCKTEWGGANKSKKNWTPAVLGHFCAKIEDGTQTWPSPPVESWGLPCPQVIESSLKVRLGGWSDGIGGATDSGHFELSHK